MTTQCLIKVSQSSISIHQAFSKMLLLHCSTLAKQERIRISERVKAGLEKSRLQGREGGRPTLQTDKIEKIREMKSAGMSILAISKQLKVSRGTIYQYL